MNLSEIVDRLKADAERDAAEAKEFLEEHLPVLASTASALSTNPVVAAVMGAVHLSPSFFAALASAITQADNDLGAAKVTAAAEATAAAQAAAAAPPADAPPA